MIGSATVFLLARAGDLLESVRNCAKAHSIAISGSFLEQTETGQPANTFYFIEADGSISAKYRKLHLFTLFREEQHVEKGMEVVTATTSLGRIGCSVCYDLRFPELFRSCTLAGAAVQLLPAAFPHPRLEHWQTLVRARAIENQSYFIAVNQCGLEKHSGDVGDIRYFGHSMVVDPWGTVLFEADETPAVSIVEIDPSLVAKVRERLPSLRDRRADVY